LAKMLIQERGDPLQCEEIMRFELPVLPISRHGSFVMHCSNQAFHLPFGVPASFFRGLWHGVFADRRVFLSSFLTSALSFLTCCLFGKLIISRRLSIRLADLFCRSIFYALSTRSIIGIFLLKQCCLYDLVFTFCAVGSDETTDEVTSLPVLAST
jgi:hypothetical protein